MVSGTDWFEWWKKPEVENLMDCPFKAQELRRGFLDTFYVHYMSKFLSELLEKHRHFCSADKLPWNLETKKTLHQALQYIWLKD